MGQDSPYFVMNNPFPPAFRQFLELFNRGDFWESHEVLETPWRENRSDFYKGLILFASAFVHVQRGNPRGIDAQFRKTERHLEPYRPNYLGLDVDAILAHATRCRTIAAEHLATESEGPGDWETHVPLIRLEPKPEWVRGDEPELDVA